MHAKIHLLGKTSTACAISLALMTGCAGPGTQEQQYGEFHYGEAPTDYQATIKGYMASQLKDPVSAQYAFTREPVKAWTTMGGRAAGWGTCVGVNAKNSYGGYTGNKRRYFLIRDNVVIRSLAEDGTGGFNDGMVDGLCRPL